MKHAMMGAMNTYRINTYSGHGKLLKEIDVTAEMGAQVAKWALRVWATCWKAQRLRPSGEAKRSPPQEEGWCGDGQHSVGRGRGGGQK